MLFAQLFSIVIKEVNESYRGQCKGYAYTSEDLQCPSDAGPTWKFSKGSGWLDAGEGLLINCYNRYNSTCSLDSPCPNGQGHCDDDSHCVGLLVCGTDNCENGLPGMDCCTDVGNVNLKILLKQNLWVYEAQIHVYIYRV